jgi:hypothetical protein
MTDEINITAHSTVVLDAFNELCSRAYSDWCIHKAIFSDNPRRKELEKSIAGHGLEHFSILSQESILLQIAKLHDPAVQQGHITLGVEYMVRFGGWDNDTEETLHKLKQGLDELAAKIRPARHKVLSHNDLETILSGATLGAFPDGEDDKYFKTLQEFADVINLDVIGGKRPFRENAARISGGLLWFFREDACKNQPIMI